MPRPTVSRRLVTSLFASALAVSAGGSPQLATAAQRDGPAGGGGSVVLQPVPATASTRPARRVVFSCVTPHLVIFADRPCGADLVVRELRLDPAATGPGRTGTVMPESPRESARGAAGRDALDEPSAELANGSRQAATCERLQAAVQALDDRMRNGYTAREAGRLWDRWREARGRLREADC
jgi:hypothetical protein